MEFPINDVVGVIFFCTLLWWKPSPVRLLPALMAVLVPLYPVDAAFTSFVCIMLFDMLYDVMRAMMAIEDK